MTKGAAIHKLTSVLKISEGAALGLIATLPSPYAGDESMPESVIDALIAQQQITTYNVNLRKGAPQNEKDFDRLGAPVQSSPPAASLIAVKQIAVASGPNGSYVAALDNNGDIWLWFEGGTQFHKLPRIEAAPAEAADLQRPKTEGMDATGESAGDDDGKHKKYRGEKGHRGSK